MILKKDEPAQLFPEPLSYERIWLEDEDSNGEPISYTDCMESSVLRFMQAVLFDPHSISPSGVPTKVDLELIHTRVKDPEVVAFFEENPNILKPNLYNITDGFETRQAWSRLMNKKNIFNYKRATNGVYKNCAVQGRIEVPTEVEILIEMEPCLHNILSVFRYFLGVDFDEVDQGRSSSWSKNIEAHSKDVSASVQSHFDAAAHQLSRPGMALQFRVRVPNSGDNLLFFVNVDIAVNGWETWRWVLTRRILDVGDTETARRLTQDCAVDSQGNLFFLTSVHSHIDSCIENKNDIPTAVVHPEAME